jgi:DNA-binding transcriptional LysR family regulator
MSVRRNLPSLNALVVLEAAARHRSFTTAAVELGVTQAAVSRQIAMLEEDLGTPLFVRRHRAVEPTPPCQLLASSLAMNFAAITESVAMVRATKPQDTVTIGATLAFSTLWLLPRLRDFRERYPGAQIRVMSQDARIPLTAGEADVIVRFGTPPFDDGEVVASRADVMFPVCSPACAERIAGDPMAALRNGACDLIGHDVPDRTWGTWPDWFRRVGWSAQPPEPALRFNHYSDALQSARAGQGVLLGWGMLVQGSLEEGALVRLGDLQVAAEGRYNVVVPHKPKPNPLRDVLTGWMAEKLSG